MVRFWFGRFAAVAAGLVLSAATCDRPNDEPVSGRSGPGPGRCGRELRETVYLLAQVHAGGSCPAADGLSNYLGLYRYRPGQDTLERVGSVSCPHGFAPEALTVDPEGRAYVMSSVALRPYAEIGREEGGLLRIDLSTGTCSPAPPAWYNTAPSPLARGGGLAYGEWKWGRGLFFTSADPHWSLQFARLDYERWPLRTLPAELAWSKLMSARRGELLYARQPPSRSGSIGRLDLASGVSTDRWQLTTAETDALAIGYWDQDFYLFVPSIQGRCDPNGPGAVPAATGAAGQATAPESRGTPCYDNGLDDNPCGSTSVIRIRPRDGSHLRVARWPGLQVVAAAAAPCPNAGDHGG